MPHVRETCSFGGTRPARLCMRRHLLAEGRVSQATTRLFELLPQIERVCRVLKTTFPTANSAIQILIQAGILIEVTGCRKIAPSAMKPMCNAFFVKPWQPCCAA